MHTELQKRVLVGEIKDLRTRLHAAEAKLLKLSLADEVPPSLTYSGQINMAQVDDEVLAAKILAVELEKNWAPNAAYFEARKVR